MREAREALKKAAADPALNNAAQIEIGFIDLNEPDGAASVAARMAAFLKGAPDKRS